MARHGIGDHVDALLEQLWTASGTDLLLTAGMPPQIRVHGSLVPLEHDRLTSDNTDELLRELLTDGQLDAWSGAHEYDFSFTWRNDARIRGNAFTQRGKTAI